MTSDPTTSDHRLKTPPDFPEALFLAVGKSLNSSPKAHEHPERVRPFAGGWNGLWARFALCAASDGAFTSRAGDVDALSKVEGRYAQDRDLFVFLVAGAAALESLGFALFALGCLAAPEAFPLGDEKAQRDVSLFRCVGAYQAAFPASALSVALGELGKDEKLREWLRLRGVVAHRASPGWDFHVSVGGSVLDRVEWLGIELDAKTTASRRQWLSGWIHRLVAAAGDFVEEELYKT